MSSKLYIIAFLIYLTRVQCQQSPMINGTNHTFVYYYYSPRPYAFRTSKNNWLPVLKMLTLNDSDSPLLSTAYLTFDVETFNEDILQYESESSGINGYFDAVTGVLSMFGTSTVAVWQSALRNVLYRASNKLSLKQRPNQHDRFITIEVYDSSGLRDKAIQHLRLKTARTVITSKNTYELAR
uniref:Uncharacterized protein n=1 Tax=Aureoumbra lagunensis TaxID=44058 RepID=A0A7S3NPF6_9STRA|mmetsp:Transcript_12893/g.19317  ORF Transcript_12893/g.19317 Transcript_12893/m.19317 type:complete len:182 (+) Transcript_12893:15-560(+)